MYDVERTDYGLRLTITGQFEPTEAEEFAETVRSEARRLDEDFSVIADLRGMEAFSPEVGEKIAELMEFCKGQGMGRSADVVESATTTLQMEQLVDRAGIDERVIDATRTNDWESQALDWVKNGVEPDT